MLQGLRQFNVVDADLDRLYQNVARFARQFTDKPLIDGIILKDLSLLSASDNSINHKLGREIQGWVIINKTAQSDIWAVPTKQTRTSKTLVLNCSADVTVSLYVF